MIIHQTRSGLVFLLFFILLCAGCIPTGNTLSSSDSSLENVLKVGVTSNSPPLIYKHNGQFAGLEAELAKKLAEYSGKKVRFVEVKWVDQIPSLISGKTDIIMSGMTRTQLRQMRIDFARPYLVAGQVSLVRRKEFNRFSNGLSDLLNPTVKIGTVKGTTGDYLIQNTVAGGSSQFITPDQAVDALIENKIDVFVYDLPMNFYFSALHETKGIVPVPVPLSREELAWGIRKSDTELLNTANSFLEHLRQSNQLKPLVLHWIPFYKNIYNR